MKSSRRSLLDESSSSLLDETTSLSPLGEAASHTLRNRLLLLVAPLLLQHEERDERRGDADGGYAHVEASSVRERVERFREALELRLIDVIVTGHFAGNATICGGRKRGPVSRIESISRFGEAVGRFCGSIR